MTDTRQCLQASLEPAGFHSSRKSRQLIQRNDSEAQSSFAGSVSIQRGTCRCQGLVANSPHSDA